MVGRNIWRLRRKPMAEVRSDVDQLRRDLTRVRDDVGELVTALVDAGRETTGQTTQQVRRQVQHRLDQMGERYRAARHTGQRAMTTAQEHPLASILTAASIGLVLAGVAAAIGMLMRR